jgi:hypothetical protein
VTLAKHVHGTNITQNNNLSNAQTEDIVTLAKRINGTVLLTLINKAYLPFAYSWLCNTMLMNIHQHVLFITTDPSSRAQLQANWPDVKVFTLRMSQAGQEGDQKYSHAGYVRLMIQRTEMLLLLLQSGIEVFLFEVDCLWLANPLPHLQTHTGYDVLVNPVANKHTIYAGGFMYLFPTNRTVRFWTELTNRMLRLKTKLSVLADSRYISEGDNDQVYLSSLISSHYGGIRVKVLPLSQYADGSWYRLTEQQRNLTHPIVINNNWVVGNKAKLERAKKWGHWFTKDDGTCDEQHVKRIVHS